MATLVAIPELFVGEDREIVFAVREPDGTPANLTTWNLEWVLRTAPEAPGWLLRKTTGQGITITGVDGPADGAVVSIEDTDTLGPGDTFLIPPGVYHYALRRTDEGSEWMLAYGLVLVSLSAAR